MIFENNLKIYSKILYSTNNFVSLLYIISKYNYLIHSLNQVTIIFGKDMPKNCLCPSILILSLSWPHFEQRIFPWNRKCGIWDTQCSSFIHEMCIKYQGWMYRKIMSFEKFVYLHEYVNVDTISVLLLLTFFPTSLHIKAMQKICLDEIYIMKHLIRYCKM